MSVQSEVTLVAAALPVSVSTSTQTVQPTDSHSQTITSPVHPNSPSSHSCLIAEISMTPYNAVQTVLPEYETHDSRRIQSAQQQLACQLQACQPAMTHSSAVSDERTAMKGCCTQGCCLHCLITVTTFRWVLLFFAIIGVSCIIAGVVLGAMHMSIGSSFITLSIMFIGLGVLLVIVIGIGWRCTPPGHEPCHLLLNLTDHWPLSGSSIRGRNRSRSGSRRRGDQNQWFGGMMYPEFEFRAPPPSYNESALDYQQTIVRRISTSHFNPVTQAPDTPPPVYQSETGTLYRPAHSVVHRLIVTLPEPPLYRTHDRRHHSHRSTGSRHGVTSETTVRPQTIDRNVQNVGHVGGSNNCADDCINIVVVENLSCVLPVVSNNPLDIASNGDKVESSVVESCLKYDGNLNENSEIGAVDTDTAWLDKSISRDTTMNSLVGSNHLSLNEIMDATHISSQDNKVTKSSDVVVVDLHNVSENSYGCSGVSSCSGNQFYCDVLNTPSASSHEYLIISDEKMEDQQHGESSST